MSKPQEREGLQGDLGAPRGGQKIPADVAQASASGATVSVGSVGVRAEQQQRRILTLHCLTVRLALQCFGTSSIEEGSGGQCLGLA